jgi:hypothetical protein
VAAGRSGEVPKTNTNIAKSQRVSDSQLK